MSKRDSGLEGFTARAVGPAPRAATLAPDDVKTSEPNDVKTSERHDATASPRQSGKRKRAEGGTVALSLRLSKRDWVRLHEVALHDAVSLTELMRRGLDRVLADKGLPPLES
jgi:hypothetical protein